MVMEVLRSSGAVIRTHCWPVSRKRRYSSLVNLQPSAELETHPHRSQDHGVVC